MSGPRRNIELKARHPSLARARAAALELGATWRWSLTQRDTFFHCRDGRLKLRESSSGDAELIWYRRADAASARASDYRLVPVADAPALAEALAAALGVRGQVCKRRELLCWRGVRIHLDEVEGLGAFVEFEAVLGPELDEDAGRRRLAALSAALELADEDRVAVAYVDLLGLA
ncbi:MAG: CYTH domain-containing protein [Nannocystaceae bacterium]